MVQRRRDETGHRLPEAVGGPGAVERRLEARPAREAAAEGRRPSSQAREPLLQSEPPHARRLLRALDLRLRDADDRANAEAPAGRPPGIAGHRQAARPPVGPELGGRPGGSPGACDRRPEPPQRRRGTGAARVRAGVHVLPAAHLRALPQPLLRRLLPLGRDVQTGGGRDRARGPGRVPRLAHVRQRLPLQEGLLQLGDRQGGEVQPLLPAHRDRAADDLLRDLRRADPLPRSRPVRRRARRGGSFRP